MIQTFIIQTGKGAVLCPAKCGHTFFRQGSNRLLSTDVEDYLQNHAGLHRIFGFVVRDPSERLASTYVQKFVERQLTFTHIHDDLSPETSREAFLAYVLENFNKHNADCHIRPFARDYERLKPYFPDLPLLAFGKNDDLILKLTGLNPSIPVNACSRNKSEPFWSDNEYLQIRKAYHSDYGLYETLS